MVLRGDSGVQQMLQRWLKGLAPVMNLRVPVVLTSAWSWDRRSCTQHHSSPGLFHSSATSHSHSSANTTTWKLALLAAHTGAAQMDWFAVSDPPPLHHQQHHQHHPATSPPSLPRSLGLSEAPGSFVLCKMECNDQLRQKFLQRFKMEFGGRPPVCLLNFLTFLPTAKTNSCPLWKRPERFDC